MATRTEVSNNLARQFINVVAFLALVVIGVCACAVPFNNNYLMDVMSKYNPEFMVSAYSVYVLHIVIYLFLLIFIIHQAFPHRRNDKMIRSVDHSFWVFVLGSIAWTFGFFYDVQALAFVGMIVAAVAAFTIYFKAGIGAHSVTRTNYWCVHFPFALIAAAMIFGLVSQVSVFCIRYDLIWWGMGQMGWTIVAILLVGFFGSLFLQLRPDCGFGCAMIWLSAGFAAYSSQNGQDHVITAFAYILVLYFAIVTFANGMHRPRSSKRDTK